MTTLTPVSDSIDPTALLAWRTGSLENWPRAEFDDADVLIPAAAWDRQHVLAGIPLHFLRQLAADGQLREDLVRDPQATLERHGIHAAPEQIPADVSLPCSEELQSIVRSLGTEEDETAIDRHFGFFGGLCG